MIISSMHRDRMSEALGLCAAAGLIQWLNHMAMTGAGVMRGHELKDLLFTSHSFRIQPTMRSNCG